MGATLICRQLSHRCTIDHMCTQRLYASPKTDALAVSAQHSGLGLGPQNTRKHHRSPTSLFSAPVPAWHQPTSSASPSPPALATASDPDNF